MATITGFVALREKSLIIAAGIISGLALGTFAFLAFRRNDKMSGQMVLGVMVVVLLGTLGYGLFVDTNEVEPDDPQPSIATTTPTPYQTPQALPKTEVPSPAPSAPKKEQPVFRGSVDLAASQAIDLETANPEPKRASSLKSPADVFISSHSFFVYDQGGYLLVYDGDPADAREGCKERFAEGMARTPIAPVPFAYYCLLTSDNRVGLVQFTQSTTTYRVGGIVYQVWD